MTNFYRNVLAIAAAAAMFPAAFSRPLVLEPSATLVSPAPTWPQFGGPIATNGEYLFVYAFDTPNFDDVLEAAMLFRRVSGQWQYQGILEQQVRFPGEDESRAFAVQDDLAILHMGRLSKAWRNVGGTWQDTGAAPSTLPSQSMDIEMDGENFVSSTGDCSWDARAHDSNSAGGWTATYLNGEPRGCDDSFAGGEVDRLGNYIVIGSENPGSNEPQEVAIFERTADGWQRSGGFIAATDPEFSGAVGLVDPGTGIEAIIGARTGAYAYSLFESAPSPHRLQPPDAFAAERTNRFWWNTDYQNVKFGGGLIFIREGSADRGGYAVINAYRGDRINGYELAAVLAPPRGVQLGKQFDVAQTADGLIVVASGGTEIYEFRVPGFPNTPSPRYTDYETLGTATWTHLMGSFRAVRGGDNHFLRQSDISGEARMLLNDSNWQNQAIEADITPRVFNGNDRWAGLMTRYRDAQNYYYLTLRSSGSVHLRRMAGGQFVELARAPVNVLIGRPYKLRLESIGTMHRVYLNGELLLDVDDATLTTGGQVGITMFQTAADYDNIIASPAPYFTIFRSDFTEYAGEWRGSGTWERANGVFSQTSVSGEARALIGTPVADQVVRARIRPTAYSTEGTQDRWSGLIARYTDDANYYYVTLRSSNQLSLRKLVNGQIVELATTPFTVNLRYSYDVRFEAVGDQLRVNVNGIPRLQAHDFSHARGSSGLMTWKTAAQFDDYVAYQP
jgi:hypothetical protein